MEEELIEKLVKLGWKKLSSDKLVCHRKKFDLFLKDKGDGIYKFELDNQVRDVDVEVKRVKEVVEAKAVLSGQNHKTVDHFIAREGDVE